MSKEKMTSAEVAENRLNSLLGDVLTVIDSVVQTVPEDLVATYATDGVSYSTTSIPSVRHMTQREAIKSLVRSMFSRAQEDIRKWSK